MWRINSSIWNSSRHIVLQLSISLLTQILNLEVAVDSPSSAMHTLKILYFVDKFWITEAFDTYEL